VEYMLKTRFENYPKGKLMPEEKQIIWSLSFI